MESLKLEIFDERDASDIKVPVCGDPLNFNPTRNLDNTNKNSSSCNTATSFAFRFKSRLSVTPVVTANFTLNLDHFDLDLEGSLSAPAKQNKSGCLPDVKSEFKIKKEKSDFQGDSAIECANLASDSVTKQNKSGSLPEVKSEFKIKIDTSNFQSNSAIECVNLASDLDSDSNSDLDSDAEQNKSGYLPEVKSEFKIKIDTPDFQGDSVIECVNLTSDSDSDSDSDSSLSPEFKPITEMAEPFKASVNPDIGNFMGNVINDGITGEFDGLGFPHCETMMQVLRSKFGMGSFRTNQLEIINAAMLGFECFVLMPTGGGKSLCYQLPALLNPGVTIVVSPLRALILDQVQYLLSLDIVAVSLTGDVPKCEQDSTLEKLQMNPSEIKLVYICPEKLTPTCKLMTVFKSLYDRNQLSRFIIDEAHCVSQWGHDFRPHYVGLAILKKNFPRVPFMAVTATATPRVRLDILHQLGIRNSKWFLSSFDRPNLKYEVKLSKKRKNFIGVLKSRNLRGKSGIVYCLSRMDCEETAAKLRKFGINAAHYHAGLEDAERKEVQNDWLDDRVHVICATIAFGMGINKRDVRFVIHHTLPSSIEGYFQESGRAGRDGNPSVCILYFCREDIERWERIMEMDEQKYQSEQQALINKENLSLMVEYCQNQSKCRRVHLLEYFGQIFSSDSCKQNPASICDNCAKTTNSDALHHRCFRELVAKCNEMAKRFKCTFPDVMGIEALKSMSLELPETPQQMLEVPGVTRDKVEQYGFQLLDITVRFSAEKSLLLNPRRRYERRSKPWKRKRGGGGRRRKGRGRTNRGSAPGPSQPPYRKKIKCERA